MSPLHLPRLVINRVEECTVRKTAATGDSAQSHGTPRVGFQQIGDAERILLMHIEQAGIRGKRGRRIVEHVVVHQGSGDQGILHGIPLRFSTLVEVQRGIRTNRRGIVVHQAQLAGQQVFASYAIQHEEVAVACGLHNHLANPPAKRQIRDNRRLRRIPVMRIVRRGREVPDDLARIHIHCQQA